MEELTEVHRFTYSKSAASHPEHHGSVLSHLGDVDGLLLTILEGAAVGSVTVHVDPPPELRSDLLQLIHDVGESLRKSWHLCVNELGMDF